MINFSSHSIQTTHRSGYLPTNVAQPLEQQAPAVSNQQKAMEIYNYAVTTSSPVIQSFVTNIAYNLYYTPDKPEESPVQPDGKVKLKIGYVNDIHGQYKQLEKIANSLDDCDIKLSGGDNMIGDDRNNKINECILTYMDGAGFEASALGNHDADMTEKNFKEMTKDLKMKYMAANFKQDANTIHNKKTANSEYIHDKLVDSYIGEYKGVKYGVVGVGPVDMKTRMSHPEEYTDFQVDSMTDTINDIQHEVDELKKQKINHIFLLSHVGNPADRQIAQNTSGIDVIIGGHSHTYVNGIKPGENLFLSKSNEPVLITNAEKDGNYFGKADLVFDKNGVLVEASNTLYDTNAQGKNLAYKKVFDRIMGEPEQLGVIRSALPCPKNRLTEENPHVNFVADAMRYELGTDISILNAGNIRNTFQPGTIDTSDTKAISPFANGMLITTINEKDLVDGFNLGAKSILDENGKPGLMYGSGLTYTISRKTGDIVDMQYTDKDGNVRNIDVKNPDPNKIYRVASDDYVMSGGDHLTPFNQIDHAEQRFDFDKDKLVADYIKHQNQPIDINQTGRIKFVD